VGWLFENRHDLERELFFKDRDLFKQELELVFLDTTSTYIYREEETERAKRGYSRDRHPELSPFVLCVAVNRAGWPISWEVMPGNTASAKSFEKTIAKFRERFKIGRVSVVADRLYIVCRNDDEAVKEAAAREAIVARLQEKLSAGQHKSLVGNLGYRPDGSMC